MGRLKCQFKELGLNPVDQKELLDFEWKRNLKKSFKELNLKVIIGHPGMFKNKKEEENLLKNLQQ